MSHADNQNYDLVIESPDGQHLTPVYANHLDVSLSPHHLDAVFSIWSFPREQPTNPQDAMISPTPVARLLIPIGEVSEIIEHLQAALDAHRNVERSND